MEMGGWAKAVPARVTFKNVQHAIHLANRAPPKSKAVAWKNVYLLSEQFKRQEDQEHESDMNEGSLTIPSQPLAFKN